MGGAPGDSAPAASRDFISVSVGQVAKVAGEKGDEEVAV